MKTPLIYPKNRTVIQFGLLLVLIYEVRPINKSEM